MSKKSEDISSQNDNVDDKNSSEDSLSIVNDSEIEKYNEINSDIDAYNEGMLVTSNSEALTQYIKKVSSFPMLTKEEEEKLFNLYIDKGDQKAGQAIVLSHLRLVVKIAMQYKNFGINMIDLISEGNVGLMIALKKFDRTKKARFSTYAGLWAKAKIQEFILKSWNMIKIGSSALRKQLLFNFSGLKKMLHIDNTTSNKEQSERIAKHFGVSVSECENAISSIKGRDVSLDTPIDNDGNMTLMDTIHSCDGNFALKMAEKEKSINRNEFLRKSLSILDKRQIDILIARYINEPKATLEDLSKKYGVSKERIRQIEESAIQKLKSFAEKAGNLHE